MSVGTLVADAHVTAKCPLLIAVSSLSLNGSIASASQTEIGTAPIGFLLTGHNVDDSSHGIGAVEHAGRASEHFHLLCHHGLVRIRNGVTHQSCILRLTVDKDHELSSASHTTDFHATCSTGRHTVADDASGGGEKARSELRKGRQHALGVALLQLRTAHGGNGKRQVTHIGIVSGSGHHHLINMINTQGVLSVQAQPHAQSH